MKYPKGTPPHRVAPKEWRHTPDLTGSYELDAMIHHSKNRDAADRLRDHIYQLKSGYSYGPRTAYQGYNGYDGDE